jgi:glucose/arabinose dehydrogenase
MFKQSSYRYWFLVLLAMILFVWLVGSPAKAMSGHVVAAWPQLSLTPVVSGLESPVYLTHAGDGSGRIFIVEQPGRIRIYQAGNLLPTPFLDITDRVLYQGEQGLLGLAFPPNYAAKGYFYVYYTNLQGDNVLARFQLTADADRADPASGVTLIYFNHPTNANHNGGQLAFGPDGYLYIGTGDGGGGGDPNHNAQNTASLLGKILRIDPEMEKPPNLDRRLYLPMSLRSGLEPIKPSTYRIPPTNPYINQPGYLSEIWALGLRNPWKFSFDRQSGDLYIGDVGQNAIEEIDFQTAGSQGGENYGWNILEGSACYQPAQGCTPPSHYSPPVAEYQHVNSLCSITGGFVSRGTIYTALQGIYLYGDFCTGTIFGLQRNNSAWQNQQLLDTTYHIASFGEDEAGELYLLDLAGGVYHITATTK